MQKKEAWRNFPGLFAAFAALMLALCALACPATAMADEETPVAHSTDSTTGLSYYYYTINEALEAGYGGRVVVMDCDWDEDTPYDAPGATVEDVYIILIEEGQKITIDMAGHAISTGITAQEDAQLTLMSSAQNTFTYDAIVDVNGKRASTQLTTGGLVTNTADEGTGICVFERSRVTLDGVAVAGCPESGAWVFGDASLDLRNGAVIEHNKGMTLTDSGGGVKVSGKGASIGLNNSFIRNNYAKYGGGISCHADDVSVGMSNGAAIENNTAQAGGGIYAGKSDFYFHCGDGNGFVRGNTSYGTGNAKAYRSGGGIHVEGYGSIEGITVADNYSASDGGGIYLNCPSVTLKYCTVRGNSTDGNGGGIFVNKDNDTINGCTITGNWCNGGKEGGGVYVDDDCDINMSGTCIVKGNTRGKDSGNDDDLFLSENWGASSKAYIKGNIGWGSSVGVRTGTTGDRRIAKNLGNGPKDCLFIDLDGYYVSYGSDDGNDAWQRHHEVAFAAKIDSKIQARYKWRTFVALVAPYSKGDDQVFWHWAKDKTGGLFPQSEYINDDNYYSNVLNFKMPQNDIDVGTAYCTRVKSPLISIDAPVAGEALPATAKVSRTDSGEGGTVPTSASVTWYEVADDGSKTRASGTAKAGTAYVASVLSRVSFQNGLYFSNGITASDVKVEVASGTAPAATSAKVDSVTGWLTVDTGAFEKTAEGNAPKSATATVELKKQAALGDGGAAGAMLLAADGDAAAGGSAFDEVEVSYSYNEVSDKVSFAAPYVEGYNFCNWEGADRWEHDDAAGTVTVPVEDLVQAGNALTAVYTPAITKAAVDLDAPVAGEALATTVDDITATCSDGSTLSFAEVFGSSGFKVTWAPEGEEDGTAGFSTAYTAVIELADGADLEDVEDVLAQGAAVTCNGTEAAAAGFTVRDGKLCLAVSFPATRDVKAVSVAQPADVELTFEQAKACSELGTWPLARTVDVKLENGEAAEGDITWQAVEGFDANATGARELTVKGTVDHIAYDGELDDEGLSREVACTVKVAAPSQDGGSGAVDGNGGSNTDGSGNADKGGKSALAKTGDSIPVFAVAAVAVIAVIAIAVAVVAALRNRKK